MTELGVLRTLLEQLHAAGIITEDLAVPDDFSDLELIYRGLCKLPESGAKRRRIDFLCVPWVSRGAALLYYTVSIVPTSHPSCASFNLLDITYRVTTLYVFLRFTANHATQAHPCYTVQSGDEV